MSQNGLTNKLQYPNYKNAMKKLIIFCLILSASQVWAQQSISKFDQNFQSKANPVTPISEQISIKTLTPINYDVEEEGQLLLIDKQGPNAATYDNSGFSTMTLIDQLDKLNQSTPFNVSHNPTLERFIRVYLQDRKDYLNRLLGKSIYFFPVFEQLLDLHDLPLEIKYLAVVESALNQVAVSPSGAKGLWQFMYGTGMDYDLYVNSYIDERYDLIKSTQAACLYLKDLYKTFQDWDLALAAYNAGPGNVKKAIRRAGGNTNYWEIRQFLPKETSSYVPAFYATMYLFTHADYHGLAPDKVGVSFVETDTIHIKKSVTFETISQHTGISEETLRLYNPVYKKDLIPEIPNKRMLLTLPVSSIARFLSSEETLYQIASPTETAHSGVIPVTAYNSYLVTERDNLNSVAKKHQISLAQLKSWNGLQSDFLIAGQRLVITDAVQSETVGQTHTKVNNQLTSAASTSDDKYIYYTVEHGDTLFKISRKFGNISIAELRNLNELNNVNFLKPGTVIIIEKKVSEVQNHLVSKS